MGSLKVVNEVIVQEPLHIKIVQNYFTLVVVEDALAKYCSCVSLGDHYQLMKPVLYTSTLIW